jgi:hypothetical protein
MWCFIR